MKYAPLIQLSGRLGTGDLPPSQAARDDAQAAADLLGKKAAFSQADAERNAALYNQAFGDYHSEARARASLEAELAEAEDDLARAGVQREHADVECEKVKPAGSNYSGVTEW